MLTRVEIANFRSILEPQVLDLRIARNVPDDLGRFAVSPEGRGDRAPKVVALFGPNASGKSNVLRAITCLAWFARHSVLRQSNAPAPFIPFQSAQATTRPTRLAVEFGARDIFSGKGAGQGGHCRYRYEASVGYGADGAMKVLGEWLSYRPAARMTGLFERREDGRVKASQAFALGQHAAVLEAGLRPDASVVGTLAHFGHPPSQAFSRAIDSVFTNIVWDRMAPTDANAAEYFGSNPALLDRFNTVIERSGLGIGKVQAHRGPNEWTLWYHHEGLDRPLPHVLESEGTRQIVRLWPLIQGALDTGGLAVLDELDIAFHPSLLSRILGWFYDPVTNPKNAQLWMTCQNASLLEELDKEEVYFCRKNRDGVTEIYGLSNIQGVRRTENHYGNYLGGAYGALPIFG